MKTKNKPVEVWGMERNVQIPVRIFASDDDLSSDGKLILCSRNRSTGTMWNTSASNG